MALPELNATGDLPPGVHRATWSEVAERFGGGTAQRGTCTRHLVHLGELARRTGCLERLIIFGSYVTAKPEPNDVDVILVMNDAFRLDQCPMESRGLFDHPVAQARLGASVFWVRPGLLIGEKIEEFVSHWQLKRDGAKRGIVDVML